MPRHKMSNTDKHIRVSDLAEIVELSTVTLSIYIHQLKQMLHKTEI